MRVPSEVYQMQASIQAYFPHLRAAQQQGLAWWVFGVILAQSACESAVVAALLAWGQWHTLRQRLREWLYDGADKAAACHTQVEVSQCFEPLARWVLSGWRGRELALALDVTLHRDRVAALVISVLYRGNAIPVAWCILPANTKGSWMEPILGLLERLRPALPASMQVLLLADRGLWSPRLWRRLRQLHWHPLLRVQNHMTFTPNGRERTVASALVAPGQAWVGRGQLGVRKSTRLTVTLIAVWTAEQQEPWAVVTDLAPTRVGIGWYALRMWVELGFRALKGMGWQWQRTRRTDPARVARYWLVLAVATHWALAYGTRVEQAQSCGIDPARLRLPPLPPQPARPRVISLFRLGLSYLRHTLTRGRLWTRLWLAPEPWPNPPAGLLITIHASP